MFQGNRHRRPFGTPAGFPPSMGHKTHLKQWNPSIYSSNQSIKRTLAATTEPPLCLWGDTVWRNLVPWSIADPSTMAATAMAANVLRPDTTSTSTQPHSDWFGVAFLWKFGGSFPLLPPQPIQIASESLPRRVTAFARISSPEN